MGSPFVPHMVVTNSYLTMHNTCLHYTAQERNDDYEFGKLLMSILVQVQFCLRHYIAIQVA